MMSSYVTPPVVGESERFPTGLSQSFPVASDSAPSPQGVRPFGLRFAAPLPGAGSATVVPLSQWCDRQQLNVMPNGQPWHQSITAGTKKTTGHSTDGGPSTGGEEWSMD